MTERPAARAPSASPRPAGAATRVVVGRAAARMRTRRCSPASSRAPARDLPVRAHQPRRARAQHRTLRPLRSPLRRPP